MNITIKLLGDKGPKILLCLTSIILIFYNIKILFIFLLGYYINLLINQILKNYINDKRPYKYPLKNRMPSGHAQAIFYVFGFLYFYIQNLNILLIIYLLFIINTIYITLYYKYHTIDQVIIGGLLGIFISYIIFFISKII
jgi:membrane-associated phospholipid phosphatase